MSDRTQTARAAADALRQFAANLDQHPVVIGFDGFVDSIIDVVDKRHDLQNYERVKTIDQLGHKFIEAGGKSSNYELVTKLEKLGGNGPIMANAMTRTGFAVTYLGALGHPALHPVFQAFAERARCESFSEPGYTDALEFDDGKIMLGKHSGLKDVNAQRMVEVVGEAKLREILGGCRLLGMVNWTMLTNVDGIWAYLIEKVLPDLPDPPEGRRTVFVDLTDPEKRTAEDLAGALDRCRQFQSVCDVVCGYNLKEAVQVAEVLGLEVSDDPESKIELMAKAIRKLLNVRGVVIHPRGGAAAAIDTAQGVQSAVFSGPLVKVPKLSTGAGDNFNAGFCLGMLAGLPVEQILCVGTATSGYYVRNAASPTLDQLADFCDDLPAPE
ncbi:MAG: PfkB family carbohydrate kinase [Phycisphaerae bacterium]|nr:PfkB family carbohydrate kinase [Phycisphaerae bacterium]